MPTLSRAQALLATLAAALTVAVAGTAVPASAARHHRAAQKKRHKAKSHKGAKGDKGDRGDKGEKGDKGDKGDPASNLVARVRLAAPASTGDEQAALPLDVDRWTAAPDEADELVGSATVSLPAACDVESDPIDDLFFGPPEGDVAINVRVDGQDYAGDGFVVWDEDRAGKSVTVPLRFDGKLLAGDAPTTHTVEALASDSCSGDGQAFTVSDLRINVYGMR